jgi:hypothetical protein
MTLLTNPGLVTRWLLDSFVTVFFVVAAYRSVGAIKGKSTN